MEVWAVIEVQSLEFSGCGGEDSVRVKSMWIG